MGGGQSSVSSSAVPAVGKRGRIVRRYFLIFAALVGGALVAGVVVEMLFRFQETHRNLEVVHRQMAELAALQIRNYVEDRKSTRLNSSHLGISYAVFCLKKKKTNI